MEDHLPRNETVKKQSSLLLTATDITDTNIHIIKTTLVLLIGLVQYFSKKDYDTQLRVSDYTYSALTVLGYAKSGAFLPGFILEHSQSSPGSLKMTYLYPVTLTMFREYACV